jgi:hypothetical protein
MEKAQPNLSTETKWHESVSTTCDGRSRRKLTSQTENNQRYDGSPIFDFVCVQVLGHCEPSRALGVGTVKRSMGVAGVAWGIHSGWGEERIHLNNVVEPAQDRGFDCATSRRMA